MNTLIILNRQPYDGTDVTWNALRLAGSLLDSGVVVQLFLMNDSVDLARDVTTHPDGYFDLTQMLKELITRSVVVKVAGRAIRDVEYTRVSPILKGPIRPR